MNTISNQIKNPFPGLRSFNTDERHLFFGRETQTEEVLGKIIKNKFIAIMGSSGSGKSSFLNCDVLPILSDGFSTEFGNIWEIITMRPGNNPIEVLGESIIEKDESYDRASYEDRKIKRATISTLMKGSSLGLVEAAQFINKDTNSKNYLIHIDQFEELFQLQKDKTTKNSANEVVNFINMLIEAVNYEDISIHIVISMRSDSIGECTQFVELTKKINDSNYLIPMLTREQKRKSISAPIEAMGAKITPGLVERLLDDIGDSSDQLPVFQHALMRIWTYWDENKKDSEEAIDIRHYEAIGTVKEALSIHANEAYDELDSFQKEICALLFKTITEKKGEGFGTKRPALLHEIATIGGVSVEEVASVVEVFRGPSKSLLLPSSDEILHNESIVYISHESLMRVWERLRHWINEEAEAASMYLRLSEASTMHQTGRGGLWRPPDLQLALNWKIKYKPTLVWGKRYDLAYERTMVFLEYSKKEFEEEQKVKGLKTKRSLQLARITALIMGSTAVVSVIFLLFAFVAKTEAQESRKEAESNFIKAESNRKLAEEQTIIAKKQTRIANISKKKADLSAIEAKKSESKAVEERIISEEARGRAVVAESNAKDKEKIAIEEKAKAEVSQKQAETAKEKADQLRYLSLSKSLAITATKNIPDSELKGLLAMQGYNFNVEHAGTLFNADVYDGVYKALKQFDDLSTRNLQGHSQQVNVILGSGDRTGLFSADSEGRILHWSVIDGKPDADTIVSSRKDYNTKDLVSDSKGKWLIASGDYPSNNDSTFVSYFNLSNNKEKRLEGFKGTVKSILVLPSENTFLALQNNGTEIIAYNLLNDSSFSFINPSIKINNLSLSLNGKYLVGAGDNGQVIMWNFEDPTKEELIYETKNNAITSVCFSPSGEYVVAGNREGEVSIIELSTKKIVRKFSEIQATIKDIEFSHDGKLLAVASFDGSLRVWDMDNLKLQPLILAGYSDWASALDFTANGEYLLGGGYDGEIKVWPMNIKQMADKLCTHIERNLTDEEWEIYVANLKDIEKEKTCKNVRD